MSQMWASVRFRDLIKQYTYKVPEGLNVERGDYVVVPTGYISAFDIKPAIARVVSVTDKVPPNADTVNYKSIYSVIDMDAFRKSYES